MIGFSGLKQNTVQEVIQKLHSETASVSDPDAKKIVTELLNLVEQLCCDNDALKKENQQLKNEVNELKGEQGKPNIKGKTQKSDHSSEQERKGNKQTNTDPKKRNSQPKLPQIKDVGRRD